jgi:acetyl-CoA carboxylase carboxyltransferase component
MSNELDSAGAIARTLEFLDAKQFATRNTENSGVQLFQSGAAEKQSIIVASNPDPRKSAIGIIECEVIQEALAYSRSKNLPLIFLWCTTGARISEGAIGLSAISRVLQETLLPRQYPVISVVLGPTAGIGSYLTTIGEFSFFLKGAQMFMTGPRVVAELTKKIETKEQIGGYEVHEQSGIPTEICENIPHLEGSLNTLLELLHNANSNREFAYKKYFGHSINILLMRISGRLCGKIEIAERLGEPTALDIKKLNMFLRASSALRLPLVTHIDTRGLRPGSVEESNGALLQGAELMRLMDSYPTFRLAIINGGSIAAVHLALGALGSSADYVLATADAEISTMTKSARRAFSDSTVFTPQDLLAVGVISEIVTKAELTSRIEFLISERA